MTDAPTKTKILIVDSGNDAAMVASLISALKGRVDISTGSVTAVSTPMLPRMPFLDKIVAGRSLPYPSVQVAKVWLGTGKYKKLQRKARKARRK